ncbi:hypothetical protein CVU83_01165 [Candidatus Falkowbacteria bacterium HGW-Falkowbacteria-2]|uniref:Uncharacterized protein n=1 Tax=Candidatus Falkowbacteria bacterium HGW-Falkowbacteria-2 TaxID=2013769 RepID=A0A2N2E1X9_9BACT|nr:MAG: hypothetical protein CVU83_01165 [Candidatus Falkowbacteria bacterium HGW-Falkowbacteria-2]
MTKEDFWRLYDKYVDSGNYQYLPELSEGLAELETPNRVNQLKHSLRGWKKILAWQVTRNQTFIHANDHRFYLEAHEIIMWHQHWDRDMYISRIPSLELVSGAYLNPSNKLSLEDEDNYSEKEWNEIIIHRTFTDERGLYLPLFEKRDVLFLLKKFMDECRDNAIAKATENFWP